MIDLHVHTSMSDGTLSPEEVARLASRKGLQAIAITDHDTLAGVAPAQIEAGIHHVEVAPGVEISTEWPGGILHVLGYFVDPNDGALLRALERLREGRLDRVPKIIAKLNRCNVRVTSEEVMREAVGSVPGRPHVAGVMLQKGYVRTIQEAFDRYLRRGGPAYVKKVKLPPQEAVKLIANAGGLAVLAHPYSLNQSDPTKLEDVLLELIPAGLQGIEAYYPRHTPEQTRTFVELASKLNLAISGGTDFHGSNKPEVQLGVIPGMAPLPYAILDELKRRRRLIRHDVGPRKMHPAEIGPEHIQAQPDVLRNMKQ